MSDLEANPTATLAKVAELAELVGSHLGAIRYLHGAIEAEQSPYVTRVVQDASLAEKLNRVEIAKRIRAIARDYFEEHALRIARSVQSSRRCPTVTDQFEITGVINVDGSTKKELKDYFSLVACGPRGESDFPKYSSQSVDLAGIKVGKRGLLSYLGFSGQFSPQSSIDALFSAQGQGGDLAWVKSPYIPDVTLVTSIRQEGLDLARISQISQEIHVIAPKLQNRFLYGCRRVRVL